MDLKTATIQAERLVAEIAPSCVRVEIAGSIRRRKAEVKDIELVIVPKWVDGTLTSLFGDAEQLNAALTWAFDAEARGAVRWIKPGTSEIISWEPKRHGKYWRGLLPSGAKLDLFLAQPDNFGAIFLIRTGSAEFSQATVTHAKRIGKPCVEGFFTEAGQNVRTPEERDVFEFLGLEYVEPELRTDGSALRMAR